MLPHWPVRPRFLHSLSWFSDLASTICQPMSTICGIFLEGPPQTADNHIAPPGTRRPTIRLFFFLVTKSLDQVGDRSIAALRDPRLNICFNGVPHAGKF